MVDILTRQMMSNSWTAAVAQPSGNTQNAVRTGKEEDSSFDKLLQQKQTGQKDSVQKNDTKKQDQSADSVKDKDAPKADGKSEQEETVPEDVRAIMVAALLFQTQPEETIVPKVIAGETVMVVQTEEIAPVEVAAAADVGDVMPDLQVTPKQQTVITTEAPKLEIEDAPEEIVIDDRPVEEAPVIQTEVEVKAEVEVEDAPEVEFVPVAEEKEETVEETNIQPETEPVFQKVETTPVKVAEAPKQAIPIETDEGKVELADQLATAVVNGEDKVELTLSPASLGKITVEITHSETGVLNIVMHTETPKTMNLLQLHSNNLQNALAANTRTDVRIQVQHGQEAQQQFLNPDGQQQKQQQQNQREQNQNQEQNNHQDGQAFMQRLRLGLLDFM